VRPNPATWGGGGSQEGGSRHPNNFAKKKKRERPKKMNSKEKVTAKMTELSLTTGI
jgi:hypothetical protein